MHESSIYVTRNEENLQENSSSHQLFSGLELRPSADERGTFSAS